MFVLEVELIPNIEGLDSIDISFCIAGPMMCVTLDGTGATREE